MLNLAIGRLAAVNDDTTLLAGARQLDPRALASIHDQYYPEIYRFGLYRTGDASAAEDIAAEVFLRLLDALHAGRPPRTTLRGWLFGVAAHLVADHFRRRPSEPLADSLAGAASPAAEAEANMQRGAVQSALARLTPEQQQVLALRFSDGATLQQTAAALGKSVNAVKQMQWRAVEALRRDLAAEDVAQ